MKRNSIVYSLLNPLIGEMIAIFQNYTVEIINDPDYILGSAKTSGSYSVEHYGDSNKADQFRPSSQHGIRVKQNGIEIASAIICGTGGATGIHEKSFIIKDELLFICCSDNIYCFELPSLQKKWNKKIDLFTCFGLYNLDTDILIHGELIIRRINIKGEILWEFGAKDIFVTPDGKPEIEMLDGEIRLTDWKGYQYILDEDGKEIKK